MRGQAARLLALAAAASIWLGTPASVARADDGVLRLAGSLPHYRPVERVHGTIRIWGHGSTKRDFMGRLLAAWAREFARYQPGVRLENDMYGTSSAIGALSLGAADLALLGEEISPASAAEFARAKGYAPTQIDVATGSLDVPFYDYAHAVFVRADNPLQRITVAQLDAIFGTEHRRGLAPIRTWDALGLAGEYAGRPIAPYGWRDLDFSLFVQSAVLGGSHRWNPALRDFAHVKRADGTQYDAGQQIVDAVAADKYGIGISSLTYVTPAVRALPLAVREGGPYYAPTKANLVAQRYPLTRVVPAFVDRPPGGAVAPAVREFLRYLLSAEGQAALVRYSAYLPLNAHAAREQVAKLDGGSARARTSSPAVRAQPPAEALDAMPVHAVPAMPAASTPLRVWSSPALRAVVSQVAARFGTAHPGAKMQTAFRGSDVAIAALYCGLADVALVGREPTANEIQAFEWMYRYRPTAIAVMLGSPDRFEGSPPLGVFVDAKNPLERLSLPELERIFGTAPSAGAPIRTWDEVGAGGPWAGRPIVLYGPEIYSGTGRFFRHAVMHDSRRFDWERMHEFSAAKHAPGCAAACETALVLDGVATEHPGMKTVALVDQTGVARLPRGGDVASGRYPLGRTVYAVINRPPDRAGDLRVESFLDFLLGSAGQAAVAETGTYIPLPKDVSK